MTDIRDRPNTVPWPPLLYLGCAAAAIALHWLVPLPWPGRPLDLLLAVLGAGAVVMALSIEAMAVLTFRRLRTNILPHRPAGTLITGGLFAVSRNPIYLANTILTAGAGLALGIAWLLLAAIVAAFLTQKLAIEREERHLEARFGEAWTSYAARTPRWFFF